MAGVLSTSQRRCDLIVKQVDEVVFGSAGQIPQ